jgi:hypothetical protein
MRLFQERDFEGVYAAMDWAARVEIIYRAAAEDYSRRAEALNNRIAAFDLRAVRRLG